MADGHWRRADPRLQAVADSSRSPVAAAVKRQRSEYAVLSASPEFYGYYPCDEDWIPYHVTRDTESIGASCDCYLRSGISSYDTGESVTAMTGGMGSHHDSVLENQNVRYNSNGRQETPLLPDTSSTIYMDGLRADCTCRAVAHIFCPFVGFREVRLVRKEFDHPGADPLVLCFVDFGLAAVVQEALQESSVLHHALLV
ncbi:hypothetical protein J5N97_025310 [Dioscorea zingiberensis]|uniref:RRM domain-containing protein n=1 Tax=Dioscorea zingiberensis TaxID=325984 RepID=A0A9D5C8Q6_9LILI|nr:hypothetical protein J5N97_025310 [Dioscorea zingiberensis]